MSDMEGGVIGALLNDSSLWDEAASILKDEDFTSARFRRAWQDISALVTEGSPVDLVIMADRGHDIVTLGNLQANTVASSLLRYVAGVEQSAMRRRAAAVLGDSHARVSLNGSDVAAVVADTQASLEGLSDRRQKGYHTSATALAQARLAYAAAAAARGLQGLAGVPTGLQPINKVSSGLRKKKLYGLAARPSTGKTSLAMQIAFHAASAGFPAGIVEMEMDADELVSRAVACQAGTPYWHITAGNPEAAPIMASATLPDGVLIDDSIRDISAICARASEWRRKYGMELLILDHLGLVKGGSTDNRARELGEISFDLKWLAKRLDIPVLILIQLNRAVETRTGKPVLSDLRDSGEIEENLDAAMFLHCDKRDTNNRIVEFGTLKNRGGQVGWSSQPLKFDAGIQRWTA